MNDEKITKKYTESLFFEIFLTGKYIKKMGEQHFQDLDFEFTTEEFSVLDIVYENENICQRNLALQMLTNRANIGKILNKLEDWGYIKRTLAIKANRPVKLVSLTEKGKQKYINAINKLRNTTKVAIDDISKEKTDEMIEILSGIREKIKSIIRIDI